MGKTVTYSQTTVAVTTSAAELLEEKTNRNYLLIQNKGSGTVYLNFGGTATEANGIKIDPEEAYEPHAVPSNAISVIGSAAASLIVVEG